MITEDALPDGINTVAEAFAAATEDLGEATPEVSVEAQPADMERSGVSGEQAEASVGDQPEGASTVEQDELDALLLGDDEDGQDESLEGAQPVNVNDPQFWDTEVVHDGEKVTLNEMRQGYMRQADYTKKTQELAEMRKLVGEAHDMYQQLQKDPLAFYNALGVELKVLDPSTPVAPVEGMPRIVTDSEIEEQIQQRLDEAVKQHPDVQRAALVQAQQTLDKAFERIEQTHNVRLSPDHRKALLNRAVEAQTGDLDLVFQAMLGRAGRKKVTAGQPPNGTARPSHEVPDQPKVQRLSVAEALQEALAEAAV